MLRPAVPPNERERLAALERYRVLDTPAERPFDELARLAALTVGVPIALVSLIDDRRQWFKARYGLETQSTPRDVSFCGHVVAGGDTMVVTDAAKDERFADNPLVLGEPRVRFYAGVPLTTPDGFALGTLCAIDHRPRELTREQREALTLLARQVVDQLEARRHRHLLTQAHRAAATSDARLQALFDALTEGVLVHDAEACITTANSAAARILGTSMEALAGRSAVDPRWVCTRDDGSLYAPAERPPAVVLRTGRPVLNEVMGIHREDEGVAWVLVNCVPLEGETGRHEVLTTLSDITELREAQQRLARQQRLVTTGTLAAGVGHEINNPLSYLMSNVEFVMEELRAIGGGSPTGRLRELVGVLRDAFEGAVRIQKIVRGLRTFAREDTGAPVPTDLAVAVDTAIRMSAHELRHKASVTARVPPGLLTLGDESRLSQVLVNILTNAGQAFASNDPSRNQVTVEAHALDADRVELTVTDNGPGIAPEVLPRVFDPFFTTKPVGVGTGLGLSISRNIIAALGGELELASEPGVGTTVRLRLPRGEVVPSLAPPSPVPATARSRVLVIDDEAAIASALARALGREHDVTVCSDPRQARALLLDEEDFDAILCDLEMPHLTGPELYRTVVEARPALGPRFVFMSGGSGDPQARRFLEEHPNERVDKPFSITGLRKLVARVVERTR